MEVPFKIENDTDLHCKVVEYIRRLYPEVIVGGLGELQNTCSKRINYYKKCYMKGQPDIMIMNYHKIIPDFVLNLKAQLLLLLFIIITKFLRPKRRWKRNSKLITITLWSAMIMIL